MLGERDTQRVRVELLQNGWRKIMGFMDKNSLGEATNLQGLEAKQLDMVFFGVKQIVDLFLEQKK